nr:VWA domain-containing protein [Petrachloros mirabilis]
MGLRLVSAFQGRDIVFAIDLTQSVGLSDEGRLRLRQIIQDSLQKGDSVYIVPFASTINPLSPTIDPISAETALLYKGSDQDIDQILQAVPLQSDSALQNTDIQKAESVVYKKLAELNQCRLAENQGIRFQAVVWLTDAPLLTEPGISSDVWVETPADSSFRQQDSQPSLERQSWIDALPIDIRSQAIDNYKLSVVDIQPTVQEFCTPAPGGRETCLVNAYLVQQLWLPGLVSSVCLVGILGLGIWGIRYWRSLNQTWKLQIKGGDDDEALIKHLKNGQKISIGGDIECPGPDVRGYLRREGNQLFLDVVSSSEYPIYYKNTRVTQRTALKGHYVHLNCPNNSRDFELTIRINT